MLKKRHKLKLVSFYIFIYYFFAMKKYYVLLFFFIVLASCSSGGDSIDSSAITNYQWKLTALKTSQPIDLNLDGIATTDMTLEFDCISNEGFQFNQFNEGNFRFSSSPLACHGNQDDSIKDYFCVEGITTGFEYYGDYKMIDENTIELQFKEMISNFNFVPYTLNYELIGDKLIQTIEQSYPTTYNAATTQWINSTITVTREYSKI